MITVFSIFVETSWSAKETVRKCHQVIGVFGYSEHDLQIILRD